MSLVAGIYTSVDSTFIEIRDSASGELVSTAAAAHDGVRGAAPGEADVSAWLEAVRSMAAVAEAHRVEALAVAGPLHSLVVLDTEGVPLRQALLAEDTRSGPDAGWCAKKIPIEQWLDSVGSAPSSALTVTKFSWLHRTEPEVWSRMARCASVHDFLSWSLAGGVSQPVVSDRATLSGTGLWSPSRNDYDPDVLTLIDSALDWAPILPRLVDPLAAAGHLGGVRLAPGMADVHAVVVGLGLVPGDVAVIEGDRTVVVGVSAAPVRDGSGAIAVAVGFARGYLPMLSVAAPDTQSGAGLADKAMEVVASLAAAGVGTTGRFVVASQPGSTLAGDCAGSASRVIETVDLSDVAAAGAARRAAATLAGSWPTWPSVQTVRA